MADMAELKVTVRSWHGFASKTLHEKYQHCLVIIKEQSYNFMAISESTFWSAKVQSNSQAQAMQAH